MSRKMYLTGASGTDLPARNERQDSGSSVQAETASSENARHQGSRVPRRRATDTRTVLLEPHPALLGLQRTLQPGHYLHRLL